MTTSDDIIERLRKDAHDPAYKGHLMIIDKAVLLLAIAEIERLQRVIRDATQERTN